MEAQNHNFKPTSETNPTEAMLARIVAIERPYTGTKLSWLSAGGGKVARIGFILFWVAWFLAGAIFFLAQPVKRSFQTQSTSFDDIAPKNSLFGNWGSR